MKRKILALLNTAMLILCIYSSGITVQAAEQTVANAEEFVAKVVTGTTDTFKLSATTYDLTATAYATIATFGGKLLGPDEGYAVINTKVPLFGAAVAGFEVKNIKLTGAITTAAAATGALFNAASANGTIENCINEVNITAGHNYAGGFIGQSNGGTLTITNVINKGNIKRTGVSKFVGGIAGGLKGGTVTGARNYGTIQGDGAVGGIVGHTNGTLTVKQSFNSGEVEQSGTSSLNKSIGGIVGYTAGAVTTTIEDAYNAGQINVTATDYKCGGIYGDGDSSATVNISRSYNAGAVSGTLTGEIYYGTPTCTINPTKCYFLADETDSDTTKAIRGLDEDAMKVLSNFDTFTDIWTVDTGSLGTIYPYPQLVDYLHYDYVPIVPDGSSAAKAYPIDSPESFMRINTDAPGKYYKLTGSFTLGSVEEPFDPFALDGHLDGKGKTITVYINKPEQDGVGLFTSFGATAKSSIKNLTVDGSIKGKSYVGGIIGNGENTNSGTVISNCTNKATIEASDNNSYAGGIVGRIGNANTSISSCTNLGTIIGKNFTAGIAGQSFDITLSKNHGEILALGAAVGGIAGRADRTISSSYNAGNVTGTSGVGGIAGTLGSDNRGISNCYNIGTVTILNTSANNVAGILPEAGKTGHFISNCYNLGNTMIGDKYVNQPIISSNGISAGNITATDCYYLGSADDGFNNTTPILTVSAMKSQAITGMNASTNPSYGYPEIPGNLQLLADFELYEVTMGGERTNGEVSPPNSLFIKKGDTLKLSVSPSSEYYASIDIDATEGIFETITNRIYSLKIDKDTAITVNFIPGTTELTSNMKVAIPLEAYFFEVTETTTVKNQDTDPFTLEPNNPYCVGFVTLNKVFWGWTLEEYGVLISPDETMPTVDNSHSYKSLIPITENGNYGILFYGDKLVDGDYYLRGYATYKNDTDGTTWTAYNDDVVMLTVDTSDD